MGFSRQEYRTGLPCPPPGDLPDPGIRPRSPKELQADSLPFEPPGKPDVSRLAGPNFGSNIRRWIREGEGRFRSDLEVH